MRTIAMLGTMGIMALSGCALDARDEERVDEAREALSFSLTARGRVGPDKFHVSQGGWVEVTITGLHLSPAGCSKVPAGKLILVRQTPRADVASRAIKADGKDKFETWNGLPAGDYEIAVDPIGEFPACHWIGDVFVQSS